MRPSDVANGQAIQDPAQPPTVRERRPDGVRGRLEGLIDRNFGTFRGFVRLLLAQMDFVLGRLNPWCRPVPQDARLVFVCLGNINRSAFGEVVARDQGQGCCSIGLSTATGNPATPQAIATARGFSLGLDIHAATDFPDYVYQAGDVLLAMEVRHVKQLMARGIPSDAIRLLGYWGTPRRLHIHDPHTLSDEYFGTCFSVIHSSVRNLCAEMQGRAHA